MANWEGFIAEIPQWYLRIKKQFQMNFCPKLYLPSLDFSPKSRQYAWKYQQNGVEFFQLNSTVFPLDLVKSVEKIDENSRYGRRTHHLQTLFRRANTKIPRTLFQCIYIFIDLHNEWIVLFKFQTNYCIIQRFFELIMARIKK